MPERREEVTTEGGLDVVGRLGGIAPLVVDRLREAGIRVSLFIEPDAAADPCLRPRRRPVVELHTGAYCLAVRGGGPKRANSRLLTRGARQAAAAGLEVHAGHGIDYETVGAVAAIGELAELNIGHFLIGEAIFTGLDPAIRRMRALMDAARDEAAA